MLPRGKIGHAFICFSFPLLAAATSCYHLVTKMCLEFCVTMMCLVQGAMLLASANAVSKQQGQN